MCVTSVTNVATWALPGNLIQIPVCIVAIICALLINPWKDKEKKAESGPSDYTVVSDDAARLRTAWSGLKLESPPGG